jgi:hypothetical protein
MHSFNRLPQPHCMSRAQRHQSHNRSSSWTCCFFTTSSRGSINPRMGTTMTLACSVGLMWAGSFSTNTTVNRMRHQSTLQPFYLILQSEPLILSRIGIRSGMSLLLSAQTVFGRKILTSISPVTLLLFQCRWAHRRRRSLARNERDL